MDKIIVNKQSLPISKANYLINHGPTVLVSSGTNKQDDVMALAWQMPVSGKPMRIAISVAPERFSHELIMLNRAFAINLPTISIYKAVLIAGSFSGRNADKFEKAGLTRLEAQRIPCPLIQECIGHIECEVVDSWNVGDHTLFLGEVVAASVDEGVFDEFLRLDKEIQTLHHMGGRYFAYPLGMKELAL